MDFAGAFSEHCETSRMLPSLPTIQAVPFPYLPCPAQQGAWPPAPPTQGQAGEGVLLSTCYKQLRNNIRMKSTVDTHLLLVYIWLVFIFFYSPPQEEGLLFPVSWLSWEECSAVQCTPSYPSPSSRWTVLIKSWLVLSSPGSRLQAPGAGQEGSTIWKWETIWSMEKLQLKLSLLQ